MRPLRAFKTANLALAFVMTGCAASAGVALEVEIRARQVAPGEPIRIVVSAPVPLTGVEGSLSGESLAFVPESSDRTRWAAWAAIALDRGPGPVALEVRASGPDPSPTTRTTLIVAAKSFPEQRLSVEDKYVNPGKAALDRIARERRRLDAVYSRRTVVPGPVEPFVKPVPGEPTSSFGLRRFFNDEPRAPHSGLDLRAAAGTPVRASGPGEVVLAEDLYFSGKTVILDHGGGLFTIYMHLSRIDVAGGAHVPKDAILGLSGATGRVTGPHLHWGARVGETVVDPRAFLDPALFPPVSSGR